MSAFLEEYGKVIVVVLIIAALVAVAYLFKRSGKQGAQNALSQFDAIANNGISDAANER